MLDEYAAIGALADPVRRRLYEYVVAQAHGVGREEAASGASVPLHSARFHLDKLVDEGLLDVEHRRISGRSGPGAGRPAKLYRRTTDEIAVSLPARGYDLVASVLATAVERTLTGEPVADALSRAAREHGRTAAAAYDGSGDGLDATAAVLGNEGFEPTREGDSVVLRNCPFDRLARSHTALVCGVNLDFVGGVIDGLRCPSVLATLDPADDRCCVRVAQAG